MREEGEKPRAEGGQRASGRRKHHLGYGENLCRCEVVRKSR